MPTPLFNDMYRAAVIRDCSLAKTVINLKAEFGDTSYLTLVLLAESLHHARVEFMDAIDATEAACRATKRRIVMSCPRCGDKYCANAELVQFIVVPKSGK